MHFIRNEKAGSWNQSNSIAVERLLCMWLTEMDLGSITGVPVFHMAPEPRGISELIGRSNP